MQKSFFEAILWRERCEFKRIAETAHDSRMSSSSLRSSMAPRAIKSGYLEGRKSDG